MRTETVTARGFGALVAVITLAAATGAKAQSAVEPRRPGPACFLYLKPVLVLKSRFFDSGKVRQDRMDECIAEIHTENYTIALRLYNGYGRAVLDNPDAKRQFGAAVMSAAMQAEFGTACNTFRMNNRDFDAYAEIPGGRDGALRDIATGQDIIDWTACGVELDAGRYPEAAKKLEVYMAAMARAGQMPADTRQWATPEHTPRVRAAMYHAFAGEKLVPEIDAPRDVPAALDREALDLKAPQGSGAGAAISLPSLAHGVRRAFWPAALAGVGLLAAVLALRAVRRRGLPALGRWWARLNAGRQKPAPGAPPSPGLVSLRWRKADASFVALFERHYHPQTGAFTALGDYVRWKVYTQFEPALERGGDYRSLCRAFCSWFHPDRVMDREFTNAQLTEIFKHFQQHFLREGDRAA
jgi:hypothetical protein